MLTRLPTGRVTLFETLRFLWHLPTLVRLHTRLIGDSGVTGKCLFAGGCEDTNGYANDLEGCEKLHVHLPMRLWCHFVSD